MQSLFRIEQDFENYFQYQFERYQNILKDPQYNDYFEAAVQNCIKMEDKDFEMVDQWNEGGGLYYF